jgi:cytochrome oxidase Cu insertion factor (SCO1/SenC/PrrC family)
MRQHSALVMAAAIGVMTAGVLAQNPARDQLARGTSFWDRRLAKSAIAALETAARNPETAAEAHEMLGRIYTFKGWQQEAAFPGWHDEPSLRARALAELKAAVAADPARTSAQTALKIAESFAAADKVDPAPPRPEIRALDAKVEAALAPDVPMAIFEKAFEARAEAQGDAAPFFTAAQRLIERGEYDRAIALAALGAKTSDQFVDENLSAYQMTGKSEGSKARGQASAADLIGWAQFMKRNYPAAEQKLGEAERLSQGLDFATQFHIGELARAQSVPARARRYYLDALSLAGGPAPLRQKAKDALAAIQPGASDAAGFDAWLEAELTRRRDERKAAALKSLVDRPLPKLALTTADGKPFDASILRGKVVLLDFFASWCGICRAELPQLKTAYAKYQGDPTVVFLLVSIDEDDKRLQRYLGEMKFPFPIARLTAGQAEQSMGFDNVPATFYVDTGGVVRYQLNGSESHGDSAGRVAWYIDQVKQLTR